jgi:CBS domain-containing protein
MPLIATEDAREVPPSQMNKPIYQVLASKGRHVEVVLPDMTVQLAVELMTMRRIGSLLVVDDDALVGIITEQDLVVRVLATQRDPSTTMVHEVMTRNVVVIRRQDSVADAMIVLTRHRCGHLPVVDDDGKLCGIVSAGDLTAWVVRDQQQTIEDLHLYISR